MLDSHPMVVPPALLHLNEILTPYPPVSFPITDTPLPPPGGCDAGFAPRGGFLLLPGAPLPPGPPPRKERLHLGRLRGVASAGAPIEALRIELIRIENPE